MLGFRFLSATLALICAAAVAACGTASGSKTTITVAGSTALQPLVEAAAAEYMAAHPGVQVEVDGGGSGKGVFEVTNHTVDIGDSDVPAKAPELDDHQVATVAFALVHGPNVGVESLTKAQIAGIFSHAYTNWKQVGGHDQAILVVNRPLGSGTRQSFTTLIMDGKEPAQVGAVVDSSEALAKGVKNQAGAIGYVAASYAAKFTAPIIAIAGARPTIADIRNGTYRFWTYEHMYTSSQSSPESQDFIKYVQSDDGAIDRLGFIAIKDVAKAP
jgi:phosphate transport system substrate-binding protein